MTERPHGTVTFLFTDIEGSTQLLKQVRDRYGGVLEEHQRVLREAFAAYGGEEIDTQGDAFFYVFRRARDAAAAAADAQRALAAHAWPDGAEVRVRIGLHTAEPNLTEEGRYHGLGVHRTARVMAVGHGGQVLASQATASVLDDDELEGITLRDLGVHSLKDLDRPERIYQLDIEGLGRDFPPLKSEVPDDAAKRRVPLYRRPLAIVALAGIAVAAVAIPVLVFGGSAGDESIPRLSGNSVGVVDARSADIVGEVPDIPTPARVAEGEGAVWVTSPDAHLVSRIDPESHEVRQTIPVGEGPTGIAAGGGDIWVANTLDGTVSRIDPAINQAVGQPIKVGNSPTALAFGDGSMWVANLADQSLSRLDARTGKVVDTWDVEAAARGVAFGGGSVWLSDGTRNRVVRVDPDTGEMTYAINVGSGPTAVAFSNGSLWVTNSLDGSVSQIDAHANKVRALITVGSGPNGLAVSGNDVWVTDETGGTLVRIDAAKGTVAEKVRLGSRPSGVALTEGSLFVAAQGSTAAHRGGTLRLVGGAAPGVDSIDPGKAYSLASWPILSMTHDGLVAFKRVGGADGTQLVSNLATSVPSPTNDGKTYAFQLRRGIRFSNGKLVGPADVRRSFERQFAIPSSPGPSFFAGLVGAAACTKKPKSCDLSRGVVTDAVARTVTFRLTKADPEFLYKLAMPPGSVVPATSPRSEVKSPLPGTGPYALASYKPNHGLRLVRNPHFRVWSAAAKPDGYPDEIRWQWNGDDEAAIKAVERGDADILFSEVPGPSHADELTTQYAAQVHLTPQSATSWLIANARKPPFDDVRVRRAVAYALDRNELVRVRGGPLTAQPTCQILPPNFTGYRPYCPYTLQPTVGGGWSAPDLAKAKALVEASGTRGSRVQLAACTCITTRAEARYVKSVLERLGYRVTLDVATGFDGYFELIGSYPQIALNRWNADFPAASNFIGLLACDAFSNLGQYCNRDLDRKLKQAADVQVSNPQAAHELWAKLDRQATDAAAFIPLYTPRDLGLVSKRVGNFQHHPLYYALLDQLWVQ